jgi:hypothetical protein
VGGQRKIRIILTRSVCAENSLDFDPHVKSVFFFSWYWESIFHMGILICSLEDKGDQNAHPVAAVFQVPLA